MLQSWTFRLIIANIGVYILTLLRPDFARFLAFVPVQFFDHPWTIITYMFAHDTQGFSHILFNMLALFFFGPRLELELGSKHFLGLYFLSGLMGALLHLLFSPAAAIVGASGAIFGVMIGYAYFWPRDKVYIWGILPVEVRIMVIIMTVLSLFGGFGPSSDGIAHFAHLGGFAGGFMYLLLLRYRGRIQKVQAKIVEPIARAADIHKWKSIPRERLHEVNRDEFDRIIQKLEASGVADLTETEKAFLDRFSK